MSEEVWNGKERRTNPRFGVKNSSVMYRRAGLFKFLNSYSPRYLIINISLGGVYFITKEALSPGTVLEIVMEAPMAAVPMTAKARVVWVKKSTDFEAWRVGVRFLKLSDRSRKLLRHVLDNTVIKKVDVSTSIYLKEIERL